MPSSAPTPTPGSRPRSQHCPPQTDSVPCSAGSPGPPVSRSTDLATPYCASHADPLLPPYMRQSPPGGPPELTQISRASLRPGLRHERTTPSGQQRLSPAPSTYRSWASSVTSTDPSSTNTNCSPPRGEPRSTPAPGSTVSTWGSITVLPSPRRSTTTPRSSTDRP